MDCNELAKLVEENYCDRYSHFKEFYEEEQYRVLWNMCINTVKCHENMINIVFCNDTYQIPPVRVFVDINRKNLDELQRTDSEEVFFANGQLKTYIKQSLGAFWGMVFRFGLGYADRRPVSVVKQKYYGIATASRFVHENEDE